MNKTYSDVCVYLQYRYHSWLGVKDKEKYKHIWKEARSLWRRKGKPLGKDFDIWTQAKRQISSIGQKLI